MTWDHAGQTASSINPDLQRHDLASGLPEHGEPIEVEGEFYLVSSGYLVPYFRPSQSESERHHIRERLNMELCDRVFRISDARDVARDPGAADAAIEALMTLYETTKEDEHRGIGRVLFGRIVSRIRTLSKHYLDLHRDHTDNTLNQDEINILKQIHDLYEYVMVQHRDIFECVRLFDQSPDQDGIIEEVFSEIGKTQQMAIEVIYLSRVRKIGAAMQGMGEVGTLAQMVLHQGGNDHSGQIEQAYKHFTLTAQQLVGIPSSDHFAYDWVASIYVDAHDKIRTVINQTNYSHQLKSWLIDGVNLIHSMQNLRDKRPASIAAFALAAKQFSRSGKSKAGAA